MVFMPWTKELEIGIAEIDEQHQWLVNLTNQLHETMSACEPDNERIGDILEQLIDYTMNHFIVEEELFERLGYPETEAHKAQHNVFCQKIMELLGRHDSGETVGVETLDLLKNWLLHHICKVDKAYVEHFRSHGAVISDVALAC